MAKRAELEPLRAIDGSADIYTARKGSLRMVAIKLKDGTLCLYSPVTGLTDLVRESIEAIGKVSAILSPNHFHHLGVSEYKNSFPEAELIAPLKAAPRLKKQTGFDYKNLESLLENLPSTVSICQPPGLKASEAWIEFEVGGYMGLVVCDAFGAAAKPDIPAQTSAKPRGAFGTMCVEDKNIYSDWAVAYITSREPTLLLPCHGGMVRADALYISLITIVETL